MDKIINKLEEMGCNPRKEGDNYRSKCPAHGGDNERTLTIFNNGINDPIGFHCHKGCTYEDIKNSIGLNNNDLITNKKVTKEIKERKPYNLFNVLKRYEYKDIKDNVLYIKNRLANKQFPYSHMYEGKEYNGKGEYNSILYNLSNVVQAIKNNETIIFVEGEKDSDNLNNLGFIATTKDTAGRSLNKDELETLRDSNIVIFYDLDDTGIKSLNQLKLDLSNTVKSMKVAHLESDKKGFDISDYIEENKATKEDILKLIDKAEKIDLEELKKEKEKTSTREIEGISVQDYSYIKRFKNESIKYLSTFIISLNKVIINIENNKVFYDLDIYNSTDRTNIIMDSTDFNNKNKFMNHLNKPSFSFFGSQNELQEIKFYLSKQDYETSKSVNSLGIHKIDEELYFIGNESAMNKDLKIIYDITLSEDRKVVETNILDKLPATKEELKILSKSIYNFNELQVTSSIMGLLPIFLLKPLLFNVGIKVPHLIIYGEAGSGKSQTTDYIINQLFNLGDNHNLAYNSITKFTLHKKLSSTNNIPIVIEEYKPSYESEMLSNLVSGTLRSCYDCHTATRGRADQSIEEYQLLAPMILVGEEGQEERAIKERSIILNLSVKGRNGKEKTFQEMKSNKNILNSFGRLVLNYILGLDLDQLELKYHRILKQVNEKLKGDRVSENIATVILGNDLIQDIYSSYGLDLVNLTGVSTNDIMDLLIDNQKLEAFDGTDGSISNVDRTLEVFSLMTNSADINTALIYGVNYAVTRNNELLIHMPSTFEKFRIYINKNYTRDQRKDLITNDNQFIKQLSNENYHLGSDTKRLSNTTTKHCHILDLMELGNRNIEIENFKNG